MIYKWKGKHKSGSIESVQQMVGESKKSGVGFYKTIYGDKTFFEKLN